MKTCCRCKKLLALSVFSVDKRASDGTQSACRQCCSAAKRAKYSENTESGRERRRQYYAAHRKLVSEINARSRIKNSAAVTEAKKAYYERVKNEPEFIGRMRSYVEKHREQKRAYDRNYRSINRATLDEKKALWRKENASLVRVIRASYKARRRAQEKQGDSTSAIHKWAAKQEKVCVYCRTSCQDSWHIEHVTPLSRGGEHRISNLAIACPTCNLSKNAKTPDEWMGAHHGATLRC